MVVSTLNITLDTTSSPLHALPPSHQQYLPHHEVTNAPLRTPLQDNFNVLSNNNNNNSCNNSKTNDNDVNKANSNVAAFVMAKSMVDNSPSALRRMQPLVICNEAISYNSEHENAVDFLNQNNNPNNNNNNNQLLLNNNINNNKSANNLEQKPVSAPVPPRNSCDNNAGGGVAKLQASEEQLSFELHSLATSPTANVSNENTMTTTAFVRRNSSNALQRGVPITRSQYLQQQQASYKHCFCEYLNLLAFDNLKLTPPNQVPIAIHG